MNSQLETPFADEPTSFAARFTTAEFLRMCDAGVFDDMKVELVHGELQRMNQPRNRHAALQSDLLFHLRLAVQDVPQVKVLGSTGIDLADDTVLGCDAALVRPSDSRIRMLWPEEVLLVVEVSLSTLSRDMSMKRVEYARREIPAYWIVDGKGERVLIYSRPVHGDYRDSTEIPFGQPLPVPGTDRTIVIE